jgi:urease accessory protein
MALFRTIAALGLALLPTLAEAHVGVHAGGFTSGVAHPFTGLDHLLAMIAVGFWAATLGGAERFFVPAAFVAVLALGATFALHGGVLPAVELMVAASVIVLGLMIAFEVKVPVALAAALVSAFALFHGHAHGAEMPALAGPLAYGVGLVLATLALHGAGFALGSARAGALSARFAGGAIAAGGLALALAV